MSIWTLKQTPEQEAFDRISQLVNGRGWCVVFFIFFRYSKVRSCEVFSLLLPKTWLEWLNQQENLYIFQTTTTAGNYRLLISAGDKPILFSVCTKNLEEGAEQVIMIFLTSTGIPSACQGDI